MPVSKRLRFEILRRDNHQCRYCGGRAPEAILTIDHVVPTTLGGSDDPANLVAACKECNAGKSSIPADSHLVADVAADALRWAEAMKVVAATRAAARKEADAIHEEFFDHWNSWTYKNWRGEEIHVDLPGNWESSVDQFLASGLEMDDLHELIKVAMGAKTQDEWRYFCGCCWRRIKDAQEHAARIVASDAELDGTDQRG